MIASRESAGRQGAALLGLLEPGWRRDLTEGSRAADVDVEPELLSAVARALGDQSRSRTSAQTARDWPACVVVALVRVATNADRNFWPAWHAACGLRLTRRSEREWGEAFLGALTLLGIATDQPTAQAAILAQTASRPAPAASAPTRLEPFGRGVLIADSPAIPDEVISTTTAPAPAPVLLVFDENGEPVGPELRAEPAWVLHPADAELTGDLPLRTMVTSKLPLTWHGWRLAEVDLSEISWVELTGPQGSARHAVRGRLRPGLFRGAPVSGITTRANAPVFAAPPRVLLPRGSGRWRVEARRAGTRINAITVDADHWLPEQLWQRVKRPLLGELTIIVTGADALVKPGMRRTVTVAQGLTAAYFPSTRLTTSDGLDPAEAVLAASSGMTVSPQAVPIPADETTAEVSCVAGQVVQKLLVTPPHIRLRIEPEPGSGDAPTPWHHRGPLPLSTRGLWHGGALAIDLPGAERNPRIEVISQTGIVIQLLDPTKQGVYPLRRMADTVTANGGATLQLTFAGRRTTIAVITTQDNPPDPWATAAASMLGPFLLP